jgi:hypothetical protein
MAKFSQEFLRQMASPMGSVQGGLLSAVKGAATLPQQLQERQKAQAMQAEMAKYTPGSPEYNAALARQQVGKGMFTEAGATGAAAIQQQQAATKAAEEKARKGRLMSQALQKAARSNDPGGNAARVRNMTSEQLMKYLGPKDPVYTQLVQGARYLKDGKVIVGSETPEKTREPKYEYVKNKEGNKVATFKDGQYVETIDIEGMDEKGEDLDARISSIPQIVTAISDIDNLLEKDDLPEGVWAQLTRYIGGTEALDTEAEYSQLKNLLGLEEIAMLKKLGGGSTGLGAVSNIELQSLQNKLAYLNTITSEELQREALTDIKRHFTVLKNLAAGTPFIESIPWDDQETNKMYRESGFTRAPNGIVVYRQPGSDAVRYYDPEKKKFMPYEGS